MRWQCPHCGTPLAASEKAEDTTRNPSESGGSPADWKLFACYKCGGFSMRNVSTGKEPDGRTRDANQPPPFTKHLPRILKANRSSNDAFVAEATRHSPRQVAPPMPPSEMPIQARHEAQPPAPHVSFEILRSHLKLDSRKQKNSPTGIHSNLPRPERFAPSIARQAVLSFLLTASIGAGYLLYQQGLAIQKLATQSAPAKSVAGSEIYSDSIATGRAAPERVESARENAPRIKVDTSEPGMRYEYLDRGSVARPPNPENSY